MVTADRVDLARRAVQCFVQQAHAERELVVVDDGTADYLPLLRAAEAFASVTHVKLPNHDRRTLGELRNIAIEAAKGDWCIQWDDDEWYHPERISRQLAVAVASGVGASALRWTLMKVPTGSGTLQFRTRTGIATPGTLLFKRTDLRYPHLARNEDGVFLRNVRREIGLAVLERESSHLFVRVFHGSNTWDERHFLRRLWRTPVDAVDYAFSRFVLKDVTRHHAFQLTSDELATLDELEMYGSLRGRLGAA
jgi:glycosyltransferase involved in cell wall biosynthesis